MNDVERVDVGSALFIRASDGHVYHPATNSDLTTSNALLRDLGFNYQILAGC
jgi:hypothetical protein